MFCYGWDWTHSILYGRQILPLNLQPHHQFLTLLFEILLKFFRRKKLSSPVHSMGSTYIFSVLGSLEQENLQIWDQLGLYGGNFSKRKNRKHWINYYMILTFISFSINLIFDWPNHVFTVGIKSPLEERVVARLLAYSVSLSRKN